MNSISKLLATDGYIMVNKTLIKNLGLHEAILIGELCAEYNYWADNNKLNDDCFYSTRENIEQNTGLTEHLQRKATATLVDAGILTIVKKGLPATNYYKIDFDKLLTSLTTSASPDRQLEVENLDLNNNIYNKNKEVISNNKLLDILQPKKKESKKKGNLYSKCSDYISQYTNNVALQTRLEEYLRLRLEMAKDDDRPFYYNMWPPIVNELDSLANNTDTAIKIVEQSIQRGWKKFYPLKDNNNQSRVKRDVTERNVDTVKKSDDELDLTDEVY